MQIYLTLFISILILCSGRSLPLDTVQVNNYENELHDSSYRFSYELSDGTTRYEEAFLEDREGVKFFKVTGFYKYRGTDGKVYLVNYSSDDKGYKSSLNILDDLIVGIAPALDPQVIKTLLG